MVKEKTDFRKFVETMWIMVKYDVLPWVLVGGLAAAGVIYLDKSKLLKNQIDVNKKEIFQKQK